MFDIFCHPLPQIEWYYSTMEKLTEEQRKEIIASYKLDNSKGNIQRLCNDYNITKQYIFKLAKSDIAKQVEYSIMESKGEFTKRTNEILAKILDRIDYEIENGDKMTLSQLSTTFGILYDKSRLENNLSTSNNSISINIKVER